MNLNKILRYTILTGLGLVPFIALVVSSSMFFPFITGKNFMFRIIVEILFGLWILLLYREKETRPTRSWLLWAVVSYFSVLTLATIFSVNPTRSFWSNFERMEGLVSYLHIFAYFLILISVVRTKQAWYWLWHIALGVMMSVVTYSFFQLAGLYQIHQGGVRLDATLGNSAYLAAFMFFGVFIAALYWLQKKDFGLAGVTTALFGGLNVGLLYGLYRIANPDSSITVTAHAWYMVVFLIFLNLLLLGVRFFIKKESYKDLLYGVIVLLNLITLYETATRGAILGLIGGAMLALLLMAFHRGGRLRKITLASFGGILILIVAFMAFKNSSFVKSSPVLGRFAEISLTDPTTQSRFLIWHMSWEGFKEHPLLGWGPENYMTVFQKYYEPAMWRQEPWFDRAHDIVFDQLVNGGLLGLLTYLSIFLFAIFYLWRPKGGHRSDHSILVKSLLTGLLAGYFFQNIFVFDNITSYILFYALVAYIYCFYGSVQTAVAVPLTVSNHKKGQSGHATPLTLPVALAALIFTVFSVYYFSARGITVSQTLIKGLTPQFIGPDGKLVSSDQAAQIRLQSFQQIFQYHNVIGLTEAGEQLIQATQSIAGDSSVSNETKQNFFNFTNQVVPDLISKDPNNARLEMIYGAFLSSLGHPAEAVAILTKSRDLAPKKQLILFELGLAYLNNKDNANALAAFKTAYELDKTQLEAQQLYAIVALYSGQTDLGNQIMAEGGDRLAVINDDRFVNYYAAHKQYDQLVLIWEKRYKDSPNKPNIMMSLAGSYYYNGEPAKAIATIEDYIAKNPDFKAQGEQAINQIKTGQVGAPTK